jgi:23S rRNA C2498 (ribose-2'-O)-methylase RlmM
VSPPAWVVDDGAIVSRQTCGTPIAIARANDETLPVKRCIVEKIPTTRSVHAEFVPMAGRYTGNASSRNFSSASYGAPRLGLVAGTASAPGFRLVEPTHAKLNPQCRRRFRVAACSS